jgi:hypothetical protein
VDDYYAVIKVKDAEPEVFWIVWVDSGMPKGHIMKTSQNLTAKEVHAELKKMGRTDAEADSLIQQARDNPR